MSFLRSVFKKIHGKVDSFLFSREVILIARGIDDVSRPNMAAMNFSSVAFTVVLAFNFLISSRDHNDSSLICRDFIGKQSGFNPIIKKRYPIATSSGFLKRSMSLVSENNRVLYL